jgi:uncharacterized NAD(P)/FAD-binding protein YdhS
MPMPDRSVAREAWHAGEAGIGLGGHQEDPRDGDLDLAIVGAGAAGTFTLLNVLSALAASPPHAPVRIAVVEESGEFFAGTAYGSRSGPRALLITPLAEFVPAAERAGFLAWLDANRDRLVEQARLNCAELSRETVTSLEGPLTEAEWDSLYLPRCFFGMYLQERAGDAIQAARRDRIAEVRLLATTVVAVEPRPAGFRLVLGDDSSVGAATVVLAVGAPPARDLPGFEAAPPAVVAVADPLAPSLEHHLRQLARNTDRPLRVLVVGANATALEFIYHLCDEPGLVPRIERLTILSTQGTLPGMLGARVDPPWAPDRTLQLIEREVVTSTQLVEALDADLDHAQASGVPIAATVGPIGDALRLLVPRLDHDGKAEFALRHGMQVGRRQRRAGPRYLAALESLARSGRLTHLAGDYLGVEACDSGVALRYRPAGTGNSVVSDQAFNVLVNGTGPAPIGQGAPSVLLDSLAEAGVQVNRSGRGLVVDDDLAAAPGVFVVGPLLAGNVIRDQAVWHVEHCGRIEGFAATLATTLVTRIGAGQGSRP